MNDAEARFAAWAESEGWTVTKNGWPDFMCRRGSEVMAVEVKWSDGLSEFQQATCDVLVMHGIPTFVWTPPGPLMPVRDELVRPTDALALSKMFDDLVAAKLELEDEMEVLRSDLYYMISRASWIKDRPPRLLDIFRRYPGLAKRPRNKRFLRDDAA